ncbi:uncharacterized protein N7529_005779 [Penicillium soppii]|uniref:uncharacterized protein n=1 Tax=Penicillium soppii TaxID=69789 RepID=UPI0025475942|nr:uncharacterized protein N7529_005779 [Penicillium soppii]KAJ5863863.1 hypothetical protein N7529_005779 [Penicillium soppii]
MEKLDTINTINTPKTPYTIKIKTEDNIKYPSEVHDFNTSVSANNSPKEGTPIMPPLSYQKFITKYSAISPTSQPASAFSGTFSSSDSVNSPTESTSPRTPASAGLPGQSGKRPHRLFIPHPSKFTPGVDSPRSSTRSATATPRSAVLRSASTWSAAPWSATPRSATDWSATPRSATGPLRSPFSPSDWRVRYYEEPLSARGASPRTITFRQIVTRTVTYNNNINSCTQLREAPKGKRRKCQETKEKEVDQKVVDPKVE